MNNIIVGGDAIQNYRGEIAHAVDELQLQLAKTEQAIDEAGETWKDDNFREFQQYFNEDKEKIKPLCDVLIRYEEDILYQFEQKVRTLEECTFH